MANRPMQHDLRQTSPTLIDFDSDVEAIISPNQISPDNADQVVEDGFVKIDADSLGKQNPPDPPEGVVIAVMGVTGSGKSTFISLLADEEVEVGHGLESSTVDIGFYSFNHTDGKSVFLLDFPGFGDTTRSDADILKDISCFLATMYTRCCRLVGVLYLHRITDTRVGGSALKNLRLFERLCGNKAAPSVTFVSTMWNELDRTGSNFETGRKRQEELRQRQFWGNMITAGSQVNKHDGSREMAQQIVSRLIDQDSDTVLDIVRELVDEGKTLDQTGAGKFIDQELQEAQEKFQKELAEYQESMEEAVRERDTEALRTIVEEKEHAEDIIRNKQLAVQSLNLDLEALGQEKKSRFRNLAISLGQRDLPKGEDQMVVSKAEDTATEKRIQNLEKELVALRQKEMQYQKHLALQQVNQEAHNLAQLQRMRHMADQNQQQMENMNRQLDYERQQRRNDKRSANRTGEFFRWLFIGEVTEHRQSRTGRGGRQHGRRDDIDMDLAY